MWIPQWLKKSVRSPASCQYLHVVKPEDHSRHSCDLAAQFAGPSAAGLCHVDRSVCEACCQYPLPSGANLNPIVASLVVNALGNSPEEQPTGPLAHIATHQARQFAMRWLATCDTEGRRVSFPEDSQRSIRRHSEPIRGSLRIGLVGRHSDFGLGHQNRDLAVQLRIDRWLVPRFRRTRDVPPRELCCRIDLVDESASPDQIVAWLNGLDVVVFVESPVFRSLPSLAQRAGIRVVCIPNWEWLHAGLDWLDHVDLMLCPTRFTAAMLSEWKSQFRFRWQVQCLPWPIDTDHFQFRPRQVCRRFLYINGAGGYTATFADATQNSLQRKGLAKLAAAAHLVPDISLIVYSQTKDVPDLPANIDLRPPPPDNRLLYCDGDVCIQPSHWEGLGLPLLECQAAGLPLITTAAPPMNEHQPLATIPATLAAAYLNQELCIPVAVSRPEDVATVLRSVHGQDILRASERSRAFVEREHSWNVAREPLLAALRNLVQI